MKFPPILLAIGSLAGCATPPTRPTTIQSGDYTAVKEYARKLVQYEMKQSDIVGLSIALVDDQQVVWAEGFGYADQENKLAATPTTLYRVGSISKLFTDTAAMQLAEQGKLDIDQPLQHYLPDFSIKSYPPHTGQITLRQLMSHHSGLPRDRLQGFMTPHPESFTKLAERLHEDYTAYPPGQVFSYSNLGIALLGNVIEKQSATPFADYMRASLLMPLGMSDSSFDTGLSPSTLMAKGYRHHKPETDPPLRDVPAGGLNSSVTDLSRFISMIFAGGIAHGRQILKAETLAEMLTPQNTHVPLDLNFRVGLGWMLSTVGTSTINNAGTVAHHNGGTILFRSQMYVLPEHKLGIVVLANSSTAGQAIDRLATQTLSLALEAKTGIHQPKHQHIQPDKTPLSEQTMQAYVGDYATEAGLTRIRSNGKGLSAEFAGKKLDLIRGSDRLFRLNYTLLGIFPIKLGNLGEVGFSLHTVDDQEILLAQVDSQEILVGQRIPPSVNPGAWKNRTGEYQITNLGEDFRFIEKIRLHEEHGLMIVSLTSAEVPKQTIKIPFMPLSDQLGILLGPLVNGGNAIQASTINDEEHLLYSGYQLKKIAP